MGALKVKKGHGGSLLYLRGQVLKMLAEKDAERAVVVEQLHVTTQQRDEAVGHIRGMLRHTTGMVDVVGGWLAAKHPLPKPEGEPEPPQPPVPLLRTVLPSATPSEEPGTVTVDVRTRPGIRAWYELDRSGELFPVEGDQIIVYQNAQRTRELIVQVDDGEETHSKRMVIPQLIASPAP